MTSVSALAMAQAPKDSTYQLTAQDSINLKQYDLKEVVVEGVRKYVKSDIDKLTYDVQADEESKTKSVLDMLRKVPLVTVDGQDKIRVKGQTAFKIYKNGHPDPSFSSQSVEQILKSMPASSIKKIEVITDPGAKYDAEGTTYILKYRDERRYQHAWCLRQRECGNESARQRAQWREHYGADG